MAESPSTSAAVGSTRFDISYARLPDEFYARVVPAPAPSPRLLRLNDELAETLGLDREFLGSDAGTALLSGNATFDDVHPIAMAYAGHQFGNWVPSLGDGRAALLGEVVDASGVRRDIQLKGAGRTPFSRGGDGRAGLGPVLREFVVSEAMHALGIPTTRALAMVATGEDIQRETAEPGAVLTRVARGHIRVGTFQYFHGREMSDSVRALASYVIRRRYPEIDDEFSEDDERGRARALLDRVIAVQSELIAKWLLVGFIHGVMNTDNMSVMGETIDYGPCAFLDDYDPRKVFSSIDRGGRYAYDQQPGIGLWNLTRFAETLLPLLHDETEAAIEIAKDALAAYAPQFQEAYDTGLLAKLGLRERNETNLDVASALLEAMAAGRADFTLSFRRLAGLGMDDPPGDGAFRSLFAEDAHGALDAWLERWRGRLREQAWHDDERTRAMQATNPAFIPRNHRIQQAIDAALGGDLGPLDDLVRVTTRPFEENPSLAAYAAPPEAHEIVQRTFCGT